MASLSTSFLLRNMSMLGFGNTELALFQTSKELLDNASDSIRMLEPNQVNMEPRIEFILDFSEPLLCDIICNDTGIGIESARRILKCFNTSKEIVKPNLGTEQEVDYQEEETKHGPSNTPMSGKFGVGLNACLLFSCLKNDNRPIVIRSKLRGSKSKIVASFCVNWKTKNPICQEDNEECATIEEFAFHGTSITVPVKIPKSIPGYLQEMRNYIERMSLLPNSPMVTFGTRDFEGEMIYYGREQGVNIPLREAEVGAQEVQKVGGDGLQHEAPDPASLVAARIQFISRRKQTGHPTAAFGTSSTRSSDLFTVTCYASLHCSPPSHTVHEPAITLHLWRYFNRAPVLRIYEHKEENDELEESTGKAYEVPALGTACAVEKAIAGADWRRFGFSLHDLTLNFLRERLHSPNATTLSVPASVVQFPAESDVLPGRVDLVAKELYLVLDINGDLAYTDMAKSALTFAGDRTGRDAVIKAIEGSLSSLHSKLEAQCGGPEQSVALFASRQIFNEQVLLNQSIPNVAGSLERMIRSVGKETRDCLMDTLGLGLAGDTDEEDLGQGNAVEARLRHLLRRAYDNEKRASEYRAKAEKSRRVGPEDGVLRGGDSER